MSYYPVIKIPWQNKCQEIDFRTDFKYFRHYSFVFSGTIFSSESNYRKSFPGKSTNQRKGQFDQ